MHPPLLRVILPDLRRALHEQDRAYFRESREARFGRKLERKRAGQERIERTRIIARVRVASLRTETESGTGMALNREPNPRTPLILKGIVQACKLMSIVAKWQ